MLQATPAHAEPLIQLSAADSVLTARERLSLGANPSVNRMTVRLRAQVPAGHKVVVRRIAWGEAIREYGMIIGRVARNIAAGKHVHTYNVELIDYARDPGFGLDVCPVDYIPEAQRVTFNGIVCPGGRVATRSFIGILVPVNCLFAVIKNIAVWSTPGCLALFPSADGMVAFTQTSGCGMLSPFEHFNVLRRTLAGYARYPNLAGVLIVGLGCERNQVADLTTSQGLKAGSLMHTLVMQDTGGTCVTIEVGIAVIVKMLPTANDTVRRPVSASHIKIGLECGGSDGFSSITANPTLGAATDLLVRHGGTAILSETPEIRGVETMPTRRAVSPEAGQKLLDRLVWWENYTRGHSGQLNGVVGPGNQQGDLANIFKKSLGSATKSGTTPLQAVYEYAESIDRAGFVFMDFPGYGPVAVTGQIASGANLICFTTGYGSMFGSKPAPTIKLANNTPIFRRFEEDMDTNCGRIFDGERSVEEMGQDIFEYILRTASGEYTKGELLSLGDHEFVPWHMDIVS